MFRKSYREAMNDIKPNAAFVESVIASSKKRRPPLRALYVKYAAVAAAAVVVVSGTVLSMPLWNRVEQSTDGVISETTAVETAKPDNTAKPRQTADKAAEVNTETTPAPAGGGSSPNKTAAQTASELSKSEPLKTGQTDTVNEAPGQAASDDTADSGGTEAENSVVDEAPMLKRAVLGEADEETRAMSKPQDMASYGEAADAGEASSAKMAAIEDSDIPTPAGYYCASASPNGYTFANDEGAVIIVTINNGGEEREPYIEENGDNIYAVFTSFGLSVTINASGAERAAVEEIINSLR